MIALLLLRVLSSVALSPLLHTIATVLRSFIQEGVDPAAAAGDRRLLETSIEWARSSADFSRADADGSGEVDVYELRGLLTATFGCRIPGGVVPLTLARLMLRTFDKSGNGTLDAFEFFHLDRTMHHVYASLEQRVIPVRRARGILPRQPHQDAYMSRAEVAQFLAECFGVLPPRVRALMEETAQYEEVLAAPLVPTGASLLGGAGAFAGGAQALSWPSGAPPAPGARGMGEEILPYTSIMRLCAQICQAQIVCERMPRTADGALVAVQPEALLLAMFLGV